jgi:hypothetical protein
MALHISSRLYGGFGSDDFIQYYENYINISNGDYRALFEYGAGFEMGLPVFHLILDWIFPLLLPNQLMFFDTLASLLLFLVFLFRNGHEFVNSPRIGLLYAFALMLISIFLATQTTRQLISSIMVLYALFERRGKLVYIIIGALFHLSALPVFVFILIARNFKYGWIILLTFFAALSTYFMEFLQILTLIDGNPFGSKADYYLIGDRDNTSVDVTIFLYMTVFLVFGVLVSFLGKIQNVKGESLNVILFGILIAACYYLLIDVPLLPFRAFILFHAICLGLYMAIMTSILSNMSVRIVAVTILAWKGYAMTQAGTVFYWTAYGAYSILPFGYLH